MNAILAIKNYISEMIKECGPGMKILLLDMETVCNLYWIYYIFSQMSL